MKSNVNIYGLKLSQRVVLLIVTNTPEMLTFRIQANGDILLLEMNWEAFWLQTIGDSYNVKERINKHQFEFIS